MPKLLHEAIQRPRIGPSDLTDFYERVVREQLHGGPVNFWPTVPTINSTTTEVVELPTYGIAFYNPITALDAAERVLRQVPNDLFSFYEWYMHRSNFDAIRERANLPAPIEGDFLRLMGIPVRVHGGGRDTISLRPTRSEAYRIRPNLYDALLRNTP